MPLLEAKSTYNSLAVIVQVGQSIHVRHSKLSDGVQFSQYGCAKYYINIVIYLTRILNCTVEVMAFHWAVFGLLFVFTGKLWQQLHLYFACLYDVFTEPLK